MLCTPELELRNAELKAERGDFTLLCSLVKKQFFFSTDHCQSVSKFRNLEYDSLLKGFEFVSVSFHLPLCVVHRPSCPDGIIRTLTKYVEIFHNDETQIDNPDEQYRFQPDMNREY